IVQSGQLDPQVDEQEFVALMDQIVNETGHEMDSKVVNFEASLSTPQVEMKFSNSSSKAEIVNVKLFGLGINFSKKKYSTEITAFLHGFLIEDLMQQWGE